MSDALRLALIKRLNKKAVPLLGGAGNIKPHEWALMRKMRKGKNLFYHNGTPSTHVGVAVSYDEATQIYTLNGTTTSAGNIVLSDNFKIDAAPGEDITFTAEILSGAVTVQGNYFFWALFSRDNAWYLRNTTGAKLTSPGTISVTGKMPDKELFYCFPQVAAAGEVFDNVKVRIQIEKGTNATAWEPYARG